MEVLPGRPCHNSAVILDHIHAAEKDGVDVVAFPEMAVPGYLIGDEWEHEAFLGECEACGRELLSAARTTVAVFGNVAVDPHKRNEDGRVRKYNALFVAEDGQAVRAQGAPYPFVVKTLLPNYREFDDSRHFFDLRQLALECERPVGDMIAPVKTERFSLGCLLCEDAWDTDYSISPLACLSRHNPDLYINISSSPFTLNKNRKRNRVFTQQAARLGKPFAYVNNVGIQNNGKTVFTFDGASCLYDTAGRQVPAGKPFEPTTLTFDVPLGQTVPFGREAGLADDTVADLHAAIEYGTRKFMDLCGVRRVVIGISGGIDSSVVAALYSRILPADDLLLVNMPGAYTSHTTRTAASDLAANLGCCLATVPIGDSVELTRRQLDGLTIQNADGSLDHTLRLSGAVLENIQARDRSARILAAIAAAFGGVFTCNANKSEATVGYTTLYGDLAGYLANIADLWKTEVYQLAEHLNAAVFGREVIPRATMDIVPSAELSPDHNVDEGKGDPLHYAYHDCLFKSWVEWWNRVTPEEILAWYIDGSLQEKLGYDGRIDDLFPSTAAFIEDLERWWTHYQGMGLAKRIQAPPVLAVKRRAFGFDHRESQMGARFTRRYADLRREAIAKTDPIP